MPKRQDVGRSWRTPIKHGLLNKTLGHISGAAKYVGGQRLVSYDLCAGDGIPTDDTDFWHGTSPGLVIHHAAGGIKRGLQPAVVTLYEIDPNTFARLIDSLTAHLGQPTAVGPGKVRYDYAPDGQIAAHILVFCESGKNADLGCVSPNDCVFTCNDPNSIHDWAMRPGFVAEIRNRTWMCTTFSTMGCNVGGLKMLPLEERKTRWYPHLQAIKNSLPRYSDLVLAAIQRDAAQWAYAITVPTKGNWRADAEKDIQTAFNKIGRNPQIAWWRTDPHGFVALEDQLFLTRSEREIGLWP